VILLSVVLAAVAGCKPDAALQHAEVLDKGTTPQAPAPPPPPDVIAAPTVPIDQTTLGSVTGTIRFNGKAPVPARIDTSADPRCGAEGGDSYSQDLVVNAGKLANVFVYVKSGPAAATSMGTSMAPPIVIDQRGCEYVPHVVGVMVGGYVEFRNSDATPESIHTMPAAVDNATIDVFQGPHGAPVDKQFMQPELMIPVRSNNHPWMSGYINVSATPFYAVTDRSGHYDLTGLPAGTYLLGAVQEKLGERTIQVTVSPRVTTNGDFAFGR
jgi:hypothetical protein